MRKAKQALRRIKTTAGVAERASWKKLEGRTVYVPLVADSIPGTGGRRR